MKAEFNISAHLLPGLPVDDIRACYVAAAGNEIDSGKFGSKESSAALAANTFGIFLRHPELLPPLPNTDEFGWPASTVRHEGVVRFPWSGGRHPCLDVLIETQTALIGVESKRYEPFRPKGDAALSDAYDRDVWGSRMSGYTGIRDGLRSGNLSFRHLDAAQLIKHGFGLRTGVQDGAKYAGKRAVLFYLFAEPKAWSDGRLIDDSQHKLHRTEVQQFADLVRGNEVEFRWATYSDVLDSWKSAEPGAVGDHASAVRAHFDV